MARLACPHCGKPVSANPIGRWYAKFQCPHCRGALRFTRATNLLGLASSAGFFTMVWALVMGRAPVAHWAAAYAAAAWLVLMAVSYLLRGVEKA
jgi:hypothetical protein